MCFSGLAIRMTNASKKHVPSFTLAFSTGHAHKEGTHLVLCTFGVPLHISDVRAVVSCNSFVQTAVYNSQAPKYARILHYVSQYARMCMPEPQILPPSYGFYSENVFL